MRPTVPLLQYMLPMKSPGVAAALIGSCLGAVGCVSTGSDGSSEVHLAIDLYWEELEEGDGSESCESTGIQYTQWRLLDADGETVACHPTDDDGGCLDEPAHDCSDVIEAVLPPGEYSLELDGYRPGCRTPEWHALCESIFLDRFDEQYACLIDGTAGCEQGTPGDEPIDAGLGDVDAGI